MMVSENEDYHHDPHAPNGSQRRCDGARCGQSNSTSDDHPEYGNNVEVTTPEMSSDDDDFDAILDLPPVKVKIELKIENDIIFWKGIEQGFIYWLYCSAIDAFLGSFYPEEFLETLMPTDTKKGEEASEHTIEDPPQPHFDQ